MSKPEFRIILRDGLQVEITERRKIETVYYLGSQREFLEPFETVDIHAQITIGDPAMIAKLDDLLHRYPLPKLAFAIGVVREEGEDE